MDELFSRQPCVVLAHCELPGDLTDQDFADLRDHLQQAVAYELPVTVRGGEAHVVALSATSEQLAALADYVHFLQQLPLQTLEKPERLLLQHWGACVIDLAGLLRELYPSPPSYHRICLTVRLFAAALHWHLVAPPTAYQVVHGAPRAAPLIVEEINVASLLWARPPYPDLPNWGKL